MDHCFRHNPVAIEALLLTLAIAFLATYLFYERNLNPAFRSDFSRLTLAWRLAETIVLLDGASVWLDTS
jgi:hypothetical protein